MFIENFDFLKIAMGSVSYLELMSESFSIESVKLFIIIFKL